MQTTHQNFSSPEMVQNCTEDGIEKREMVNKYWIVLPVIAYALTLAMFIVSLVLTSKHMGNPFRGKIKGLYYMFLFIPFGSVILFPIYFTFLYLLKNQLKILFVLITFSCMGLGLAGAIISKNIHSIVTSSVAMVITAVWFYCMWAQVQMAITTIKTGLIQINRKKIKFFFNFFVLLCLATIALGLYITSVVSFSMLLSNHSIMLSRSQTKLIIAFYVVGSISLLYIVELTAAISYIYGAAFFNQFSLMKDGKIEKETSKEVSQVTNQAFRIAYKSSLGTACLGALLITIVRMIEGAANANENDNSLGAKIGGAICSCIAEALAFIATQAYVYSAMYGKGLFQSGKMALESFRTSGFDKFFNYAFSERILNAMAVFFSLAIAVASGFLTYKFGEGVMYPKHSYDDQQVIISILFGMFIFFVIELPLYSINCVIGGHTSAQIAMYVEDPDLLKRTHPKAEKFTKLLTAQ